MSNRRSPWIDRRGQRDAALAIEQVLERQPLVGEQVQQLADEQIEDSPYQARQSFSLESVEELAQGMRQAGFQGVLIVRPHSDPARRRGGVVQLVFGHRRRIAWRQVCGERSMPCLLPVVVREIDDAQLLTIGAQENLQRQDLDPLEEAQIVAWHERMFFGKNQAELGAMLGKSSDWVSTRSRISKLPDTLKERLRERPRAVGQILEIGQLYGHEPSTALKLADRVVQENLTVTTVRKLVLEAMQAASTGAPSRETSHNRRANATIVQNVTKTPSSGAGGRAPASHQHHRASPGLPQPTSEEQALHQPSGLNDHNPAAPLPQADLSTTSEDLDLLKEAVIALSSVASRAEALPRSAATVQIIQQIEQALAILQQALADYSE